VRQIVADASLQPIRNLFARPDMTGMVVTVGGAIGAYTAAISGVGPAGRPVHRVTWTTAPPPTQLPAQYTAVSVSSMIPVVPGRTYVFQGKVRSSQPWTVDCRARWTDATGSSTGFGDTIGTNAATAPGVWETRSVTAVAPAGAVFAFVLLRGAATGWTDGQVTEVTEVMVTEGSGVVPPYSDGSFPGWRWTGTAGQSESVGYPYTLESIAGTPTATVTAGGSVALGGGLSLAGASLYEVSDRLAIVSEWSASFGINASGTGLSKPTGFVTGNTGSGNYAVHCRLDTASSGSGFNQSAATGSLGTLGRHTWSAHINDGITTRSIAVDGVTAASLSAIPNSGVERATLAMAPASASQAPVIGIYYERTHDVETRNRVTAWLARRYGSPIPAGY